LPDVGHHQDDSAIVAEERGLRNLATTTHFDTSTSDLMETFYRPALEQAKRYDRGVGFFTSAWMRLASAGLARFAANSGVARIIASPILESQDVLAIAEGDDARKDQALKKALERSIDELEEGLESDTLATIAWMIADGLLEFKVACPANTLDGDFHDKFGIFADAFGNALAFNGSPNDSAKAFRNYESVSVFYSWEGKREAERVAAEQARFDRLWHGRDPNIRTFAVPEAIERRLIRFRERGERPYPKALPKPQSDKWRHQKKALESFLEARNGILEMATGTGKTRTSLNIETELFARGLVATAIVTAHGTDLLDQWHLQLAPRERPVYRFYESHKEAQAYLNDPEDAVLLVSRINLRDVLRRLPNKWKARALIICDEVHGMGSNAMVRDLPGQIRPIAWRLGLSATPEREYDEHGNNFIENEIGPVIFEFPIEKAIERGILCEFDYRDLEYEFSEEDKEAERRAIRSYYAQVNGPNPPPITDLYQALARVRKLSREKLAPFRELILREPTILSRCLIFVEDREYGREVQDILLDADVAYHTYYSGDDRATLQRFASGELDCLLTCKRISEGIDIRSVDTVVLFASARAMLETIQRLGRCLRTDPGNPDKRAMVIDFVRVDDIQDEEAGVEASADIARRDKLRAWSAVERKE